MCFYINRNDKKIKIAKQDIVCYKSVNIYSNKLLKNGKIKLYPRYGYKHGFFYLLGETATQPKTKNVFNKNIDTRWNINGGAFHSIKQYSKNVRSNNISLGTPYFNLHRDNLENIHIQCTIPKGTKYIENHREYISESIRIDYILSPLDIKIRQFLSVLIKDYVDFI